MCLVRAGNTPWTSLQCATEEGLQSDHEASEPLLIHLHVCLIPQVHAHSVLSCGRCFDEEQVLFPFLSHALSCLWADQGVRTAAARGYEYELNDSAL